jgi:hypothetical protein
MISAATLATAAPLPRHSPAGNTSHTRPVYRLDVSRAKPPGVVWVAEVLISGPVAAKIRANQGLDPDEIGRLVSSPPPRLGTLVQDDRGTRLYIRARTAAGMPILVVLSPVADDIWRLMSAYAHASQDGA